MDIRRGRESDGDALTALYDHYIRETPITFDLEPWTSEQRKRWMETFGDGGPHQLFVAEDAGRVVGYACTRRFRDKAAYDTTVETSLYLAPDATGRGIGRALYTALFDALAGVDVHRAIAGITLPNPASVAIHERFGFRIAGTMSAVGRKFGRYWDVRWYEKLLDV